MAMQIDAITIEPDGIFGSARNPSRESLHSMIRARHCHPAGRGQAALPASAYSANGGGRTAEMKGEPHDPPTKKIISATVPSSSIGATVPERAKLRPV